MDPREELSSEVRAALGAKSARSVEKIQSLWSGYGSILRFLVEGFSRASVVVKYVEPPSLRKHPRGWSSDVGHERKLKSYQVERHWYESYAARCGTACPVPRAFHLAERDGRWLFVLEDLDAAGFSERRHELSRAEMSACLNWLATFHATFMGEKPEGLWQPGTYWHLATRKDEWKVIGDARLKGAAAALDARLNSAKFQTFVHGDAKVANFCFRQRGSDEQQAGVAAVDFQYVGGGVGVKDVAYFLSSCLEEDECEEQAAAWLDVYFAHLRVALAALKPDVDATLLEAEWRALYPVAWADFMRFLLGWAPGHYKVHGYSLRMTELALLGRSP
jgi:aminoglycoside phosphotransferase (APT) family kinase protein